MTSRRRLCIFHKRMAHDIAAIVRDAQLDVDVHVVDRIDVDPPHIDDIDWLVCNTFPAGMLGRMPRLRWLQLTGVGTDHVASGEPRADVVVSHAGDVPSAAVADHVLFGMLFFARAAPALLAQQRAHAWQLPDARGLRDRTLLLLGLGRIGSAVAVRARAFGMRIVAVTKSARPSPLVDEVHPIGALPMLAKSADHVVIALPASADTERIVDRSVIASLPSHAVVVNVARGSVLDEHAVADALRAGQLRGALLDVFDREPLPPGDPLWDVPNLLATPHCAFQYPEQARDLAHLVVANARLVAAGELPRNFAFTTR